MTLIHAHTLFTDGSIAERLAKKRGLPYVVTLRYSDLSAIWKYEPHLRPMARRILRGAARVVCLGSAAREKVLGWFSGAARDALDEKLHVIPNGIDPAWLDGEPRTAPHAPVRVGFAGRMNERKHPLDALNAAHAAGFDVVACGDGPLEEKFCTAMRAGDRYLGRISGTDAMKAFYADCDVLLVPSSAETFGMVYLEAMSQGVPVLYTKGQGFDGQFPEGEIGYAVPCGDVQAQAQALEARRMQGRCGALKAVHRRARGGMPGRAIAGLWMELPGPLPEGSRRRQLTEERNCGASRWKNEMTSKRPKRRWPNADSDDDSSPGG
ncbi:MAG: glycosyltransferase [Christensenellales bacterium]